MAKEKLFDTRLGFKFRKKDSWIFTFWKTNYDLIQLPYSIKEFMEKMRNNVDSDTIYFKLERRDSQEDGETQ